MESKQNHSWLCLYRDSVYRCTSDTYNLNFEKISKDGWSYTRDVAVVNANEALVVYKDRLYSMNLLDATYKAHAKGNWDNCVGAVAYKGNAICIGRDWGTGMCMAKGKWDWKQMHKTTWRNAKMMVKVGCKGYVLGTNYVYEVDLNRATHFRLSQENWGNIRAAVVYNEHIYGFFGSGIWKLGTNGRPSVKVSSDDWSQCVWKCAVNFGKHCFLHLPNAIWYVDLEDGSFRKVNNQKWDGSCALIPIPDTQTGFNEVNYGRGVKHRLIMVGRNHSSTTPQQKSYQITVGSALKLKIESEIAQNAIFAKASVTLGVEKESNKSESITDTMTIPPGKSIAVYQEVKEYEVWSGIKSNIIGVLGDNSRESTFLEGDAKENFPEIKYL